MIRTLMVTYCACPLPHCDTLGWKLENQSFSEYSFFDFNYCWFWLQGFPRRLHFRWNVRTDPAGCDGRHDVCGEVKIRTRALQRYCTVLYCGSASEWDCWVISGSCSHVLAMLCLCNAILYHIKSCHVFTYLCYLLWLRQVVEHYRVE